VKQEGEEEVKQEGEEEGKEVGRQRSGLAWGWRKGKEAGLVSGSLRTHSGRAGGLQRTHVGKQWWVSGTTSTH
jgi:predicted transposase YdaD